MCSHRNWQFLQVIYSHSGTRSARLANCAFPMQLRGLISGRAAAATPQKKIHSESIQLSSKIGLESAAHSTEQASKAVEWLSNFREDWRHCWRFRRWWVIKKMGNLRRKLQPSARWPVCGERFTCCHLFAKLDIEAINWWASIRYNLLDR